MRSLLRIAPLAVLLAASRSAVATPLPPEHDVTAQEVVVRVPGMDRVTVRKDLPYENTESGALRLDVYLPPELERGALRPAVVFVNGVGDQPDSRLKDWNAYRSWGRLVAASGWIGVTFEARGPADKSRPDIRELFLYLRTKGKELGIDANRLAAWVCSGNVISGLPFLMDDADADSGIRAAVVYYGSGDPARLRRDLPVYFVRAGRDNRGLNEKIDRLFARAVAEGAPWTLVNAPGAHHAFDVLDETDESRRIVRDTLAFLAERLSPAPAPPSAPSLAKRALGHWFAKEYPEAAAAYREYVAAHPDDSTAWLRLGLSQAHVGNASDADASLRRAIALGADGPTDRYNVACGYALLGRADDALAELSRAIDAGFDHPELLERDPDLASVRDDPRFRELVERAKARAARR